MQKVEQVNSLVPNNQEGWVPDIWARNTEKTPIMTTCFQDDGHPNPVVKLNVAHFCWDFLWGNIIHHPQWEMFIHGVAGILAFSDCPGASCMGGQVFWPRFHEEGIYDVYEIPPSILKSFVTILHIWSWNIYWCIVFSIFEKCVILMNIVYLSKSDYAISWSWLLDDLSVVKCRPSWLHGRLGKRHTKLKFHLGNRWKKK